MKGEKMKFWAKIWKNGRMERDKNLEDYSEDTRTHKVFRALEEVCREFDLERPLWLDANIKEFKRHAKVRFRQDSFIEEIPFDYLEFQVTEEDW